MNKSVSSSSISESSRQTKPKRYKPRGLNKYHSTNTLGRSKLGSRFDSSTDSVISEYDSGAYSRESTPDFSLMLSFTDVSEPLISPSLMLSNNPKSIEVVANSENNSKLPLSKPVKVAESPSLTQSRCRPVTFTEVVFAKTGRNIVERFAKDSNKDCKAIENKYFFSSTPKQKTMPVLCKSQSLLWSKAPPVLRRSTTSVGFRWTRPARTACCSVD